MFILHLLLQPVVVLCPKNTPCNLVFATSTLPFQGNLKRNSVASVVCLSGHTLFLLAHCIFVLSVLLLSCYRTGLGDRVNISSWEKIPTVSYSVAWRGLSQGCWQVPNFVSNSRVLKMCSWLLLFLEKNLECVWRFRFPPSPIMESERSLALWALSAG